MKKFYWIVLILTFVNFSFGFSYLKSSHKFFKNLNEFHNPILTKSGGGLITYFYVSNSINGPFTSPATLSTKDSLFVKMDVTPGGSVQTTFWVDVNENDLIDSDDFPIGGIVFRDNSVIDLEPTLGVIIVDLQPDMIPSMKIIAQAIEGLAEVLGYVEFINPPASFTFSGNVYDASTLLPIKGAMVFAGSSQVDAVGDLTNINGSFEIPLDSGWYYIRVEHILGQYQNFDTIIYIDGNMIQNFYLKQFTSYIKGFVRDDLNNPIPNIDVYANIDNWNGKGTTDSTGEYFILVPPGEGRLGTLSEQLIPNYLNPQEHYFIIRENDSIVDNSISNFICYRGNATITGRVIDNIHMPPIPQYIVSAWSPQISSFTYTLTDGNGNYTLRVHENEIIKPTYGVWVNVDDWQFPFPEDVYVDTSYWNLVPGSVADFRIVPAETSAVDHFPGHWINPDPKKWNIYSYGNPWGPQGQTYVLVVNDKLEVQCKSESGLSGVGVMSRKPYSLKNREFRIYMDTENLTSPNTAHIMFTNVIRYDNPDYFSNWIKLNWSVFGWTLDIKVNNNLQTLWFSNNPAGKNILFQFLANPKVLILKIDDNVVYTGPYGGHLPFAYYYAFVQNEYNNPSGIAKFDDFQVGALGSTNVKEISNNIPTQFRLLQNYPNPFNPRTKIRYNIPLQSHVTIKIYNTLGQELGTLVNMEHKPGEYEVEFNATNLPTGVYLYKLNAVDILTGRIVFSEIKKSMLVK